MTTLLHFINAILELYGVLFPIASACLAAYCVSRIPDLLNEALNEQEV